MGKMYVLLWHQGDRFVGVFSSEQEMMEHARSISTPVRMADDGEIILTGGKYAGIPLFRYVIYDVAASASLVFQRRRKQIYSGIGG